MQMDCPQLRLADGTRPSQDQRPPDGAAGRAARRQQEVPPAAEARVDATPYSGATASLARAGASGGSRGYASQRRLLHQQHTHSRAHSRAHSRFPTVVSEERRRRQRRWPRDGQIPKFSRRRAASEGGVGHAHAASRRRRGRWGLIWMRCRDAEHHPGWQAHGRAEGREALPRNRGGCGGLALAAAQWDATTPATAAITSASGRRGRQPGRLWLVGHTQCPCEDGMTRGPS